jgi:membrane-associated phospholipid phosphatase
VTTVRRTRPALVGEVLIVLALVFAYDRIRESAHARADLAIDNGRRILSVESWVHINIESVLNDLLSQHHGTELVVSWYYQLMFLSATLVVLLWIYWRHQADYRPARNALIGMNTVALLVFCVLPVAPPRLIPGAGFVDSAVATDVADKATTISPDLYAAMPSLHMAWATWVALQVLFISRNRAARVLAVAHAVITGLAVMATANHYLLDVVAGYVLAAVVVRFCRSRQPTDVRCPHVPAARRGGRSADRDSAGIGLTRQRSYRRLGEDRCLCDRPGGPAELRARLARPGSAGRRWRASVPRDSAARP